MLRMPNSILLTGNSRAGTQGINVQCAIDLRLILGNTTQNKNILYSDLGTPCKRVNDAPSHVNCAI